MTPAYLTTLAERLHPKRFTFALMSVGGFLVLLAVGYVMPRALPWVVPFAGPFVFLPWIAFCTCSWFHSERGSLRQTAAGQFTGFARQVMRWYAALFIGLSAAVAVVVWPALAILWL